MEAPNNVVPIARHKSYRWVPPKAYPYDDTLPASAPAGSTELEEEEILAPLLLASRLSSDIESKGVRKIIIFERLKNGWGHSYVNIERPSEIIEALAPLWLAASNAVGDISDDE